MHSLADHVDVVVGVDTHKHTHTAAWVTNIGGVLEMATVAATPVGFAELFRITSGHAGPQRRVWAVEGSGSWGRQLVRWLREHDQTVLEVERPKRPRRRHGIKDDGTDAVRAARDALNQPHPIHPRSHGIREAMNAARIARESAIHAATDTERQLLALADTAPEPIASRLRGLTTRATVNACAQFRPTRFTDPHHQSIATTMRTLAKRITTLRAEAATHEHVITDHVKAWRPDLLDQLGVGPIVAAAVLNAWSHPGRIHSAAAFSMLAGTAPIPASSGLTTRHRLNRSGDRQLNRAIHTIAITRTRHDPTTHAYIERRRKQGKTDRDIHRCLKNYIARNLYKLLEHPLDET